MGGFKDFFLGRDAGFKEDGLLTGEQKGSLSKILQQLMNTNLDIGQNSLYKQGSNYLEDILGGSQESFNRFSAPALRQFNEQIVPGLAERFSGLGSGAQSSSAFSQALGSAGAGLTENLHGMKEGMRMNALQQALGYAQQPINNAFNFGQLGLGTQANYYDEGESGFLEQFLQAGAQGAGQVAGQGAGNAIMKYLPMLLGL